MTDDIPEDNDAPKPSTVEKAKATAAKAMETADKTANVAEVANNAFSAIKWVAIAVVSFLIFSVAYGAYKMVTKPVAAVGDAAGNVVEAVGDGAGAIKEGAGNVINRLDIPVTDRQFGKAAEGAFTVLNTMDETDPDGVKDRMFRRTNFGGSENRICKLTLNFGGDDLIAFTAADNEAHATAKSLGSNDDRLIRFVLKAADDDIAFNTQWDSEAKNWGLKWKKTTVSKPINDELAQARALDMLAAIPEQCGN